MEGREASFAEGLEFAIEQAYADLILHLETWPGAKSLNENYTIPYQAMMEIVRRNQQIYETYTKPCFETFCLRVVAPMKEAYEEAAPSFNDLNFFPY